jgi:hypothetical protein
LSVLSQEELLAAVLTEHWVKIIIGWAGNGWKRWENHGKTMEHMIFDMSYIYIYI